MSSTQENYTNGRRALLAKITDFLQHDQRFLAAWLAGSFGRGEETWLSDLDLHVVVADSASETLCATPWLSGGRTTPERFELFQHFGTPAIIFEAHSNNQISGTFTYVAYAESAQNVDWMLIPASKAYQEPSTFLLFKKVDLPAAPEPEPLTHEQAQEHIRDASSFFWMIAAGAAKDIAGDLIHFHLLLSWLKESISKVRYALNFQQPPFSRDWPEVGYTLEARTAALRQLCDEMESLGSAVQAFGVSVPAGPRVVVEKRLALFIES
jgi:hypothetical protein